jgi:dTDP-4-amino-4,6-dideoxygalactose transaminase
MNKPIPYGKHHITSEDITAVVEALQSDFLTQGPKIAEFEEAFSAYIGATYAVAVANGTAALHLCALALNVMPGDKVITSPITFAASANCVRYCGGEVVFADIDPATCLLDINKVQLLLESAPIGTYKGIIPVDFAGRPVDMEAFRKLADEYGLWIIEDACHAPGGYFIDSKGNKQMCGNGNYADLAIFSFHPVKHIACGEGGMITTNDERLYKRLLKLRTHGIIKDENQFTNSIEFAIGKESVTVGDELIIIDGGQSDAESSPQITHQITANPYPGWYMEMQELGFNYRLTDFQAALGLSQLKRAQQGIVRRREIAAVYKEAFKGIPEIIDRNYEAGKGEKGTVNSKQGTEESKQETVNNDPFTVNRSQLTENSSPLTAHSSQEGHAYHLYIIEVKDRLGLYNYLREQKIFAQIHYIPCHLMPYYRDQGWKEGDLSHAENYYRGCISLPMYPTLTFEEQDYVIHNIKSYYHAVK